MPDSGFVPVVLALPTLTPSLALEVLPRGVTVHRIYVQVDGKTHDLLIGPENASDFLYKGHKYFNTIVGRYSNRIPVGTYDLERNGIRSQFTAQANENPSVSLHGGPKGFDAVDWDPVLPSQATLFTDEEKNSMGSISSAAVFRHTSEDGDQGYPGTLLTEVLVGLLNPGQSAPPGPRDEYSLGSIIVVYRAKLLDSGKKTVTPINLTQHWGFNLESSLQQGEETLSVKNHKLTLKAGHVIDLDSSALSTGQLLTVENTPHHHDSKIIGDQFPDGGYDSFYVFDQSLVPSQFPSRIPLSEFENVDLISALVKPKATQPVDSLVELSSEKSGLKLTFTSNQSGVQFYSGNFITKDSARKRIHGGKGEAEKGDGYGPGTAAFLEFHEPLAAWLHPQTSPNGNDTLLTSDEIYNNFVKVDVTYRNPTAL